MDPAVVREGEFVVDIECGGTTSEGDKTKDLVSENGQSKRVFNGILGGFLSLDGCAKLDSSLNFWNNVPKCGESADKNVTVLINKNSEDKSVEEKRKKNKSSKPPKPPRPPKGPLLGPGDEKIVREIAELAMRKRARIERIKAMRKLKATKSSNFISTLSAMILTALFCFFLLFQGLCSKSKSSVSISMSPSPAVSASENMVSIKLLKNFSSAYERDGSPINSLNVAEEQNPGSGNVEEPSNKPVRTC